MECLFLSFGILIWDHVSSLFITFLFLSLAHKYLDHTDHALSSLIATLFHECSVHGRQRIVVKLFKFIQIIF